MAFEPKQWTQGTQQAVSGAVEAARANNNPEVTPDHLLAALMRQDDTIALALVQKLGMAPLMLRNKADECLQFALSLDCVDCFTIGSESRAEMEDLARKIPAASVRG